VGANPDAHCDAAFDPPYAAVVAAARMRMGGWYRERQLSAPMAATGRSLPVVITEVSIGRDPLHARRI